MSLNAFIRDFRMQKVGEIVDENRSGVPFDDKASGVSYFTCLEVSLA